VVFYVIVDHFLSFLVAFNEMVNEPNSSILMNEYNIFNLDMVWIFKNDLELLKIVFKVKSRGRINNTIFCNLLMSRISNSITLHYAVKA
jgi:hypothetical protein